jgi:acyl carrier protein
VTEVEIVARLRTFVAEQLLDGKEIGLDATTPLLEWGVLDSVSLISLVAFVEKQLGVKVPPERLKPENLANLGVIARMILALSGAAAAKA